MWVIYLLEDLIWSSPISIPNTISRVTPLPHVSNQITQSNFAIPSFMLTAILPLMCTAIGAVFAVFVLSRLESPTSAVLRPSLRSRVQPNKGSSFSPSAPEPAPVNHQVHTGQRDANRCYDAHNDIPTRLRELLAKFPSTEYGPTRVVDRFGPRRLSAEQARIWTRDLSLLHIECMKLRHSVSMWLRPKNARHGSVAKYPFCAKVDQGYTGINAIKISQRSAVFLQRKPKQSSLHELLLQITNIEQQIFGLRKQIKKQQMPLHDMQRKVNNIKQMMTKLQSDFACQVTVVAKQHTISIEAERPEPTGPKLYNAEAASQLSVLTDTCQEVSSAEDQVEIIDDGCPSTLHESVAIEPTEDCVDCKCPKLATTDIEARRSAGYHIDAGAATIMSGENRWTQLNGVDKATSERQFHGNRLGLGHKTTASYHVFKLKLDLERTLEQAESVWKCIEQSAKSRRRSPELVFRDGSNSWD